MFGPVMSAMRRPFSALKLKSLGVKGFLPSVTSMTGWRAFFTMKSLLMSSVGRV